ncbi:MAG TPA: thioredoxin family protein [Bacteroidia bacterium]|nr:thioredoxin family protein [Bacteroidia bacterium]
MPIINVTSEKEFNTCIDSKELVLVDFYADWCEPCHYLDAVLARLSALLPPSFVIVRTDIEKFPELSKNYTVLSVPVLALFANSRLLWRMNGFHLEDELMEIIVKISRETDTPIADDN